MKRNYIKPEMVIVPVVIKNFLLAGSDLNVYQVETSEDDVQYSRQSSYSLWEEE